MWNYEKRLQYPVNISRPNAEIAKVVISQFGGPYCRKGYIISYCNPNIHMLQYARRQKAIKSPFGQRMKSPD
ncbi:MAG: hypothetical protein HFG32_07450 [Eubacterium sp.]|jgi:Mn-containing catalase|nr:hypothetical protein [Eubacterium sp.]